MVSVQVKSDLVSPEVVGLQNIHSFIALDFADKSTVGSFSTVKIKHSLSTKFQSLQIHQRLLSIMEAHHKMLYVKYIETPKSLQYYKKAKNAAHLFDRQELATLWHFSTINHFTS